MEVSVEKLAQVLCKLEIDPQSEDSPERIWRDMNASNKRVFRFHARTLCNLMGWSQIR